MIDEEHLPGYQRPIEAHVTRVWTQTLHVSIESIGLHSAPRSAIGEAGPFAHAPVTGRFSRRPELTA